MRVRVRQPDVHLHDVLIDVALDRQVQPSVSMHVNQHSQEGLEDVRERPRRHARNVARIAEVALEDAPHELHDVEGDYGEVEVDDAVRAVADMVALMQQAANIGLG